MIITNKLNIFITLGNLGFYRKNFNSKLKVGDNLLIDVLELSKGSAYKIEVSCDYCGMIYTISYKSHLIQTKFLNKHSCLKCAPLKTKETNLKKYGVEYTFQRKDTKNKIKKTILKKYGVEYISQNKDIQNKIKETNLEKYGVEYISQNKDIQNKIKETNLEKYGVEYISQNKDIQNKIKETNLEKYGVENPSQYNKFKIKVKQTSLEKYGDEHYSKTSLYKESVKETNLKKYGVENVFQSKIIKDKSKKTILDKYGVEYISQNKDIQNKVKETNLEKYGVDHITKNIDFRKSFKIDNHINHIQYLNNGLHEFKCDLQDHLFIIKSYNYYLRFNSNIPLCTICHPIGSSSSIKELELLEFIKLNYDDKIISSYRDQLEIDIYLPDLNLGFEFNGLYWHSEVNKSKNYHLEKTNWFKDKGIHIIHIWQDDWIYKQDIVKSMILNRLGKNTNKIYGRKCEIKEVKSKDVKFFLDHNHIQGCANKKLSIGLYYKDELVSLMCFDHFEGRKKMSDNEWNLNRFCTILNTNVIGGASKLLKYFIDNYNPLRIVSYADKDWSSGNLYNTLGFIKLSESKPDYKYIVNGIRAHKSRFRKSNTGVSEKDLNISKIFDCGKIKYELKFNINKKLM